MSDKNPIRIPLCDFPSDTLEWMKKKATPKMAVKLMKCHKCFQHFPEFPYFIVEKIECHKGDEEWNMTTLDDKEHIFIKSDVPKKLWIIHAIWLRNFPNISDGFIPNIVVCDIRFLILERQNITFDEFQFLTASGRVRIVTFSGTTVKDENDDPVFLDSLAPCLPNLQGFYCLSPQEKLFSPNFINIYKEFDASKLKKICLNMISYNDFDAFSKFMVHYPHIIYYLHFDAGSLFSSQICFLEKYVDAILDAGITDNPPPLIEYPEQKQAQLRALESLIKQYEKEKNVSISEW